MSSNNSAGSANSCKENLQLDGQDRNAGIVVLNEDLTEGAVGQYDPTASVVSVPPPKGAITVKANDKGHKQ